jgi:hypothetical protein
MEIVDLAQQMIFHKVVVVEPSNENTYDPLYRLIDISKVWFIYFVFTDSKC